jgi:hypothetical protein
LFLYLTFLAFWAFLPSVLATSKKIHENAVKKIHENAVNKNIGDKGRKTTGFGKIVGGGIASKITKLSKNNKNNKQHASRQSWM